MTPNSGSIFSIHRQNLIMNLKRKEMTATKTWRDNRRDEPQGLIFNFQSHITSFI